MSEKKNKLFNWLFDTTSQKTGVRESFIKNYLGKAPT